jgi:hypothetical protein
MDKLQVVSNRRTADHARLERIICCNTNGIRSAGPAEAGLRAFRASFEALQRQPDVFGIG